MTLPKQLGRYQIESLLGRGGMGEVYKAFDPSLDRVVALKTIRLDADNPTFLDRLYREAKACGRLRHPRIVTVYDLGEIQGTVFIAMEYLEGENLASTIEGGLLTIEQKLDILMQTLEALHYAHSEGVVHRDIKPSNILVLPDRMVKLLDFGLARVMRADSLTLSGAIMGTPYYMSPEQLKGQRVDGRTDVYSTGVVAYEMLTRRRAFDGETLTAVMLKVLSESAPPMGTSFSAAFPEIERIVERAIAKQPDDRYQSAEEMRSALAAFLVESRSALATLQAEATMRGQRAADDAKTLITTGRASEAQRLLAETLRADPDAREARALWEQSTILRSAQANESTAPAASGPAAEPVPVVEPVPPTVYTPPPPPPPPASLPKVAPQPVAPPVGPPPAAAPNVLSPPPPRAAERPNTTAPQNRRSVWWIGAATTVLAAGLVVMLMAGRGATPGTDTSGGGATGTPEQKASGPETSDRGSTGPLDSGLPQPPPDKSPQPPSGPQRSPSPLPGPQRQTTASSSQLAGVYVDARRSDAQLTTALNGALAEKGVAINSNASAARWNVRATIQTSIRKSPFGDTSALTADFVATLEIQDAATGKRRTVPIEGHALGFGEQVVRTEAVRRAAEQLAEAIQAAVNE